MGSGDETKLFLGKECKPTELFHPDCSSHANSEIGHIYQTDLCFSSSTCVDSKLHNSYHWPRTNQLYKWLVSTSKAFISYFLDESWLILVYGILRISCDMSNMSGILTGWQQRHILVTMCCLLEFLRMWTRFLISKKCAWSLNRSLPRLPVFNELKVKLQSCVLDLLIFAVQRPPWSLDCLSKRALIAWFNFDLVANASTRDHHLVWSYAYTWPVYSGMLMS